MGNKRGPSPPIAFLVIFQLQTQGPVISIMQHPSQEAFSHIFQSAFSKLSHDGGFIQSKTSDFERQQKNQETFWSTCLANDEAGKSLPQRNQSNHCVAQSDLFNCQAREQGRR